MLYVSPLILRLGVATVLAYHGVQQVGGMLSGDAGQQAMADASGVNLSAAWSTVLGVGELCVAGLLTLGLFTRLATLPVLAGIALAGRALGSGADGAVPDLAAAGVGEVNSLVMMLLAATCLSLLVSGCGCLGLDRRFFGRASKRVTPQA
ncbi:MAG: DoxX family protein [Planctomycetota bacterium]|jgi:uncharacterized membrane protein YphA (DoxX/SURF4 family)